MNTQELRQRMTISPCAGGTFQVTIVYRNKIYHGFSHNTQAYDRLRAWDIYDDKEKGHYDLTYYQALRVLYNECKRWNHLK